jgi:hypothetical protein
VGVGLDLVARLLIVEGGPQKVSTADLEMDIIALGHSAVDLVALSSITIPLAATSPVVKLDFEPPLGASSQNAMYSIPAHFESSGMERSTPTETNLPLWRILINMAKSPRGVSGFAMTFVFGLTLGMQDSTSDTVHFARLFPADVPD